MPGSDKVKLFIRNKRGIRRLDEKQGMGDYGRQKLPKNESTLSNDKDLSVIRNS